METTDIYTISNQIKNISYELGMVWETIEELKKKSDYLLKKMPVEVKK
jgi:hypothetical protein